MTRQIRGGRLVSTKMSYRLAVDYLPVLLLTCIRILNKTIRIPQHTGVSPMVDLVYPLLGMRMNKWSLIWPHPELRLYMGVSRRGSKRGVVGQAWGVRDGVEVGISYVIKGTKSIRCQNRTRSFSKMNNTLRGEVTQRHMDNIIGTALSTRRHYHTCRTRYIPETLNELNTYLS